jgi:hypothetical protein
VFGREKGKREAVERRQAYVESLVGIIDGSASAPEVPTVLKPGERPLLVLSGAGLFEPRSAGGHWVGRSKGFSIPVPDTRMRFRVGSNRGHYVRAPEEPTLIDHGTATITDRRAIFTGTRQVREWSWAKLLGITHDAARCATAIQVSNRQKVSGITYKGGDPEQVHLAFDVATALAEGRDDEVLTELRAMLPALAEDDQGGDAGDAADIDQSVEAAPVEAPEPLPVPTASSSPPAWARDPSGRHELRWWDGTAWTPHVSDAGVTAEDPVINPGHG